MATLTLYRPVGTTELALIAQGGWKSFPAMPNGFGFFVYPSPTGDPRRWPEEVGDLEMFEALEYGQAEIVRSWQAWDNAPDDFAVVWFEIDEQLKLELHRAQDVDRINGALVGQIEICARYGPTGVWLHPRLRQLPLD